MRSNHLIALNIAADKSLLPLPPPLLLLLLFVLTNFKKNNNTNCFVKLTNVEFLSGLERSGIERLRAWTIIKIVVVIIYWADRCEATTKTKMKEKKRKKQLVNRKMQSNR